MKRKSLTHLKVWLEGLFVLLCLISVVQQALSTGVTQDPDPNGFVGRAKLIQEHGHPFDLHTRMPGYPYLLIMMDRLGPGTMHEDALIGQTTILTFFVFGLWYLLRRTFRYWIAAVFLAIFATPNSFVFHGSIMLADLVWQVIWAGFVVSLVYCLKTPAQQWSKLQILARLSVFGFFGTLIHFVDPSGLLAGFSVWAGLLLLLCLSRDHRVSLAGQSRGVSIYFGLCSIFLVGGFAISALFGQGHRNFSKSILSARILQCVDISESDEISKSFQKAKDQASAQLGYPVQYETPSFPPAILSWLGKGEFQGEDIFKSAKANLGRHPIQFGGCAAREFWWRYHILVKQYFPFKSEKRFITVDFLPWDSTPRAWAYRYLGIELRDFGPSTRTAIVAEQVGRAAIQISFFFFLLTLGYRRIRRETGYWVDVVGVACIGWISFLAFTLPIEHRYLNAFAPYIYLLEAAGIMSLIQIVSYRLSRTRLYASFSQSRYYILLDRYFR